MTIVQKFLFTTRFDKGVPAPETVREDAAAPAPPPPPPTFSEAELEAARREAFDAGKKNGLAEAAAATERQTATALAAIAQRLQTIARHQVEADGINGRNAVRVAMAAARKMLPEMARRHALEEIEALFGECVAHCIDEPRVVVRVHGSLAEAARGRLEAMAETVSFQGTLTVTADDRLSPGDSRVEWGNGGADRNQDRLWAAVEEIIERTLAAPVRPGDVGESDDPSEEAGA